MKYFFLTLMLTVLIGCLPFDKSKQGVNPLKKGGYCFWYNDKDQNYCAYSKAFPSAENISYFKCDSCESFDTSSFQ